MTTIHIGIDPGAQTGYAAWDAQAKILAAVRTLKIHEAMDYVLQLHRAEMLHSVTFEDARLRTWFGKMDAEQRKYGAAVREGAAGFPVSSWSTTTTKAMPTHTPMALEKCS